MKLQFVAILKAEYDAQGNKLEINVRSKDFRAEGALTFSAKEYRSVSQGCPRLCVCVSVCENRFWSVATC